MQTNGCNMGCMKLPNGFKTIAEEPEECIPLERRESFACMIDTEVSAVLAVMRRNARWAVRYMAGEDQFEHLLVQSLKNLRRQLFNWKQSWNMIDPSVYLKPFLDVIRSDETGAQITGMALSSLYNILTIEIFNLSTVNVDESMHSIVDAVTSCRFDPTDTASEEVLLTKILQVLLACMKSKASVVLSNQDICTVVNTCFRVVHQAGSKSELLQHVARHTMHELVRAIFSHLPELDQMAATSNGDDSLSSQHKNVGYLRKAQTSDWRNIDRRSADFDSTDVSTSTVTTLQEESDNRMSSEKALNKELNDTQVLIEPYGAPCMVEIFRFLCSLMNYVETGGMASRMNPMVIEEDFPLFALAMINSAIELGGQAICQHPKLLFLIQDELFRNLMQFGLSPSPLILSKVCSIVLNLYHHLRTKLKLQLEAFFTCVIIRLAQSRYGSSYQQQEVAMEALVNFCRQPTFMSEMYANLDCEITCANIFEDIGNLLSKSAFPVNCPLSAMHILALEGLIAVLHNMADRITALSSLPELQPVGEIEEYTPFWTIECANYDDPDHWVNFVRRKKYVKRRLMIGADHFNRDPKKGLEFLQGTHLLPEKLDPQSVACFFRYTAGLDKNLVGDFLGNHDEFCVQVLNEFAKTFDFQDMALDTALRLFLETFRLPGESQKIQRILEAFSERFYKQSSGILADKDAAFLLSYSLIMLNTDQHNVQVKKKMTEEDFIRNNRQINAGKDLPRDYLSDLYHSILKNEIRTIYEQSIYPEMNAYHWTDLMRRSEKTSPYIVCDSRPFLDHDMFAIISGPTIAAISVVFDHAEEEDVLHTCVDGFLAVAKMSACPHLEDVLDDLVVSLCKFTTLLNPVLSADEPVLAFGDDIKARMATVTVFNIANTYGDYIRTGWRNILDCILRLHKLGLLPGRVAIDVDSPDIQNEAVQGKPITGATSVSQMPVVGTPRRSSGLMGRFSQLLSLDIDEPRSQPPEQQLAAHQRTVQTIQKCHIDSIFTGSKFLHAESLLQLARALIWAAGRPQKGASPSEDEDTAVFCLEILIAITLINQDRVMLLWQGVYDHIAGIVQSTVMPCPLVEKAIFGLLRICQRLLPYNDSLTDDLLRSLQLLLKLDARVADAYCDQVTQEVSRLLKTNVARIKSSMGWRTISSLLSSTARHPEASESGFEALSFIMTDGTHLTSSNYVFFLDATRSFAESRVGSADRSLRSLELMAESVKCLVRWSKRDPKDPTLEGDLSDDVLKSPQEVGELWLRLAHGLRKVCLEQREEVRNYALLSLQKCLSAAEAIPLSPSVWSQCFDQVIFTMLDDLLEIAQGHSPKEFRNMDGTLSNAVKFISRIFMQVLEQLLTLSNFRKLWIGVLSRLEKYMKAKLRGKGSDKLQECILEQLKSMLHKLKVKGIITQRSTLGGDSLWELTWLHLKGISPSLQAELFPGKDHDEEADTKSDDYASAAETVSSEAAMADTAHTGSKVKSDTKGIDTTVL